MTSAPVWDKEVKKWLIKTYPDKNSKILDIGAGMGKYGKMLNDYYSEIYAVEPWTGHHEKINGIYAKLFDVNIKDFEWEKHGPFDVIILGDVLEHIEVEEAKEVLNNCYKHSKEVIVIIPYEYPQHINYGNLLEIHLQPDLTPKIFKQRYPNFNLLFSLYKPQMKFKGIGVYVKSVPNTDDIIIWE